MQIHCKKQCFVLGRALDGAKMHPTRVLFITTKIYLNLTKSLQKTGQAGVPLVFLLTQKMVFIFLAQNVIFHNPWFYLGKTEVSEGQGLFFEVFGVHFLVHFLDLFFFALSVILSQPMVLP